ncbi:MAG: hypothetical protein KAU94_07570, partial [Verrucomicrobia bacterium]|nr:hypothetical protein [Verrucomicrobiota bacterium]
GTYGGNLLNSGETITLSYGLSTPVISFTYSDDAPWPTEPDGSGFSLVLADPDSAPDHSLPASWIAGTFSNGTPGRDETPCPTFTDWQNMHFTPGQLADPGISGAGADPDGDSIINLLEYALGTGPFDPNNRSGLIFGLVIKDGGIDYFAITFRRLLCRDHLTYTVQFSANLQIWIDDHTTVVSIASNGDGTETVTFRSNTPLSALGKAFLRLKVSEQ